MKKQLSILILILVTNLVTAQVSKTVNVITPGTLNTLLTQTEKRTVTNLTLTGNINDQDFIIMRDTMPLLAVLDISSVNITEYNGTDGTSPYTNVTNYPANELPASAFMNHEDSKFSLKTVILPSTITSVGGSAFQGCKGITSMTIPNSVISIGLGAFSELTGLTGNLNIPNSVKIIGANAFCGDTGFKTVTFGTGVNTIGNIAFLGCSGLTGNFIIPNTVTSVGDYALSECYGLTSITIGSGVTSIGIYSFQSSYSLNNIICLNPIPPVISSYISLPLLIYVPVGSLAAYQNAPNWSTYSSYFAEYISKVSTQAVSSITLSTAVFKGSVDFLTNSPVASYGFCYNLTGSPTIADSKSTNTATPTLGSFSNTITGLSQNTTYHVRSYITDGDRTVYGSEVTFTTTSLPNAAGVITGPGTVCQGQNTVTYTVPVIPFATSYVWTLPTGVTGTSTTNSITVNFAKTATAGSITVNGRNSWGDGVTSTFPYTVNLLPVNLSTISGSTSVCQGENAVTYMVPAIDNVTSYTWTIPTGATGTSTTNSITLNYSNSAVSGNITVKGHNDCGDGAVSTLAVIVNQLPVITATDKTITCGGSVPLNITTNYSGSGTLKYAWTPSTGLNDSTLANPTSTITSNIIYTVTVTTPSGCTTSANVKVTVTPFTVNAGVDKTIICGGSTSLNTLTTNYSGSGKLRYKWTPSTGLNNDSIATPTATVTSDITYIVTVTTPNGCTASDNIKLTVGSLTANAGADKTITCGGTTLLNTVTTNYSGTGTLRYKWTPSTGLNNDSIATPTATVTSDITYIVTVTTPNGCTASDNIKLTVGSLTANAGADKTITCGGTTLLNTVTTNYSGTGTLRYKWTPSTGLNNDSIATPIATVIHNTIYKVTVTTPNGCSASDNIAVTILPMDKPQIGIVGVNSSNKNIVVWNKPVSIGIDSFYIYRETNITNAFEKIGAVSYDSLSVFVDNQSNSDLKSYRYKLSVLDRSGLESPQSDAHKTMHLSINKGQNSTWNLIWEPYEGFTVSTYNIYRGTIAGNLNFIDATAGSSTQYSDLSAPAGDVYYQMEVISPTLVNPSKAPGLKDTENNAYSMTSYSSSRSNIATNVISGINELEGDNYYINIYPNPVKDELKIDFADGSTFEILNLTGQVVYNGNLNKSTIVQMTNVPVGVYLIKFKAGNTFEYKKIIKK